MIDLTPRFYEILRIIPSIIIIIFGCGLSSFGIYGLYKFYHYYFKMSLMFIIIGIIIILIGFIVGGLI